jgi:hypothetical protein
MGKVQNALSSGVEKTRNALAEVRRRPKNALMDYTRGALMGVTTDVLGYPVDTLSMAMRPFGYNVDQPIGGSDWLANKLTSPTGSPSEMAGRITTGMLIPGPDEMLRLAGMLPKRGPVNELITYHGSPHRINNVDEANPMGKFDLSKVGTGEGVQAYGHGIYLAETPSVARTYAVPDAMNPPRRTFMGEELTAGTPEYHAATLLSQPGRTIKQVRKEVESWIKDAETWDAKRLADKGSVESLEGWKRTLDTLNKATKKSDFGDLGRGYFYTADLPDEHIAKMLDWDKPLSEQPEAVRKQLLRVMKANKSKYSRILKDPDSPFWTGSTIYNTMSSDGGVVDQATASRVLSEVGIPGIKYFDGGSRAAGNGTRNFVIFDGDTAKILKRE